jgi:hypothetical protein
MWSPDVRQPSGRLEHQQLQPLGGRIPAMPRFRND